LWSTRATAQPENARLQGILAGKRIERELAGHEQAEHTAAGVDRDTNTQRAGDGRSVIEADFEERGHRRAEGRCAEIAVEV
jgi:hypothetical protein